MAAANCGLVATSDTTCAPTVAAPGFDESQTAALPKAFALGPFAPNPFGSRVMIGFDVPRVAPMTIRVYDIGGRMLRTLHDGMSNPGRHRVAWDGRSDQRQSVASGIYFVEMRTPGFRKIGRLTLLR